MIHTFNMFSFLFCFRLAPPEQRQQAGVTSLHRDLGPIRGFGIELILTFLLVFTYFATTDPNRRNHGNQSIPLGLTVTMIHLAGVGMTTDPDGVTPANSGRQHSVGLMLGLNRRHWPNIKPALCQTPCFC